MSTENRSSEPVSYTHLDVYKRQEKGVTSVEDAIQGAMDIIAELVSDNAEIRKRIRNLTNANGVLVSVATDEEKDSVYKNYYDYKEPVKKIAGHRVLAVNRGEKEGFLKVSVETDSEKPLNSIFRAMITDKMCIRDSAFIVNSITEGMKVSIKNPELQFSPDLSENNQDKYWYWMI